MLVSELTLERKKRKQAIIFVHILIMLLYVVVDYVTSVSLPFLKGTFLPP